MQSWPLAEHHSQFGGDGNQQLSCPPRSCLELRFHVRDPKSPTPPAALVLGSKRCVHLWENSHRGAGNYRAGPPHRRPQPPLALAPAGGLIPTPAPAPSQALAAPYEGFPQLTQIPCEGSRGGRGMAVGVPLPCSCPGREVGNGGGPPKKQLPPLWHGPDRQTFKQPFLEGRGPSRSPYPAQLFLKAESVHIGKLQIVYMGNVSCPHMKIYTSLSPKCLRLEIERTVSWADLLFTDASVANEHGALRRDVFIW